ncbi:MAG: hypothetical protein EB059_02640 [Alphaproteobacteria bacterium]|nr:hypothetical protein [Alphaproteobacteria bacterium]
MPRHTLSISSPYAEKAPFSHLTPCPVDMIPLLDDGIEDFLGNDDDFITMAWRDVNAPHTGNC